MEWFATPLRQADIADSMRSAQARAWEGVWQRAS
jgi:hypothetical protein